jgi:hypothetical protein
VAVVVVGKTCADEDESDYGDEFFAVAAVADDVAVVVAAAAVVVAVVAAAAAVVVAAAVVAGVAAVGVVAATADAAAGEADRANVDGIDGTVAAWIAADEVIGGKSLVVEDVAVVVGDAPAVGCNHYCTEKHVESEWVEVRGLAENVATRHNRPRLLLRYPSSHESIEQIRCSIQVCRLQDLVN